MLYKINAYFAVLLVTIAGALAAEVIIRVAYNNVYWVAYADGISYDR